MADIKRIFLFLLVLAFIPAVNASYITIQSSVAVTNNKTMVKVTNLGDESAYNVQLSLEMNNQKIVSGTKNQLGVKEVFEWSAPIKFEAGNPGKYPLILTVNYEDANAYPFSAISVSTFEYKQPTISSIVAKMNNLEVYDKGLLELKMKNLDGTAKEAAIRLIMPKELTANQDRLPVKIPAKSEGSTEFKIEKSSIKVGNSILFTTLSVLIIIFAVLKFNKWKKNLKIL